MSWLSNAWESVTDFVGNGIADAVGDGWSNQPDDVARTQRHLGALGYLDGRASGFVDRPFDEGLKRFQRDHKLKVDGWMRPGGPTETALRDEGSRTLGSGWLLRRRADDADDDRDEPEATWGARLGGLGTALAGIAEIGAGMAGVAMPDPLTTAVGMAAVADGAGRVGTGIAEVVSGRDLDTPGQQLGHSAAAALGLDDGAARRVGDAVDFAVGLGTPANALGGAGYTAKVMKYRKARISDAIPGIGLRVDRHGKRVFNADLHKFTAKKGIPRLGVEPDEEVLLPHYHRRDTFPSGRTKPGGGLSRHRPYEGL